MLSIRRILKIIANNTKIHIQKNSHLIASSPSGGSFVNKPAPNWFKIGSQLLGEMTELIEQHRNGDLSMKCSVIHLMVAD